VALQLKASDGLMYEVFTQFMGIGSKNAEHISVEMSAKGNTTRVYYTDTTEDEHINISGIAATGTLIYGLSSKPVSAENVDDGNGNYGLTVKVTLDYPVTGVGSNGSAFTLTDSDGINYANISAVESTDGKLLTLGFVDFNSAYGKNLTLAYSPGTVQSPATAMSAWSKDFTPTGLVPIVVPAPSVSSIQNI
jgi:hypothetical protein